jgi:alkanesulfonate monooxygenase SsuD/methylene tetrahydromethanopterin reductase-like flavin-dependent oxidoreductase (luciferase family)
MSANPIGYLILTSTPPEEIPPTAKLVEELGYGELWVAEDYFAFDGFLASAAALDATESITVGLGIVSAVVRHPAVTAMAIASVARIRWESRRNRPSRRCGSP